MDVFEFAMKIELEGKAWYEKQAETTQNPRLRSILLEMAQDEQEHYELFKRMKDEGGFSGGTPSSDVLDKVKVFFEEMSIEEANAFPSAEVEAWKQLRDNEGNAEKFYREKAAEATDEKTRAALEQIADEEHKHFQLIENMISFLTEPQGWLENAEWRGMSAH